MSHLVVSYSQTFASSPDAKALFAALLAQLPADAKGYIDATEEPPFSFRFDAQKDALAHLKTVADEDCRALGVYLPEVTILVQVFEPEFSDAPWEGTFNVISVLSEAEADSEAFVAQAEAQHALFAIALSDLGLAVSESRLTNLPQPA